jgi:hypothetical protein
MCPLKIQWSTCSNPWYCDQIVVCKISFPVKSLVLVQIDDSSHSFACPSRAVDLGATVAKLCVVLSSSILCYVGY